MTIVNRGTILDTNHDHNQKKKKKKKKKKIWVKI
jgi:hypothetical protein